MSEPELTAPNKPSPSLSSSSSSAPGTKTQEMRIAELERALAAARAPSAAEIGDIPAWFRRKLGPSWDTTLAGIGTGCATLVPALAEIPGCPHWVKVAGMIMAAIGIAFLGRQAKSTKVTGVT